MFIIEVLASIDKHKQYLGWSLCTNPLDYAHFLVAVIYISYLLKILELHPISFCKQLVEIMIFLYLFGSSSIEFGSINKYHSPI